MFIVQADGKKILDQSKQNVLSTRLRMELIHPLRVTVLSRGPDTELLVANPTELSGKGRPLVFYNITLALKLLDIGIFLVILSLLTIIYGTIRCHPCNISFLSYIHSIFLVFSQINIWKGYHLYDIFLKIFSPFWIFVLFAFWCGKVLFAFWRMFPSWYIPLWYILLWYILLLVYMMAKLNYNEIGLSGRNQTLLDRRPRMGSVQSHAWWRCWIFGSQKQDQGRSPKDVDGMGVVRKSESWKQSSLFQVRMGSSS